MEHKVLPDTWLYKQTFSKLVPSPQLIQEVLDMTETKKKPKRFILRRLVVAALVMALAAALAMGANAATGGEFFKGVISIVSYSEDGETIMMTVDPNALEGAEDGEPIEFSIEEQEDGKAFIFYADKDGKTVTQEIELPKGLETEAGGSAGAAASQPGVEAAARGAVEIEDLAKEFPRTAAFCKEVEKILKS